MSSKKCWDCKQEKDLLLFHKSKDRADGVSSRCKVCANAYKKVHAKINSAKLACYKKEWNSKNKKKICGYSDKWRDRNPEKVKAQDRAHHLRTEYGLTVEMYNKMSSDQNGECSVCGKVPMGKRGYKVLHVDHCHSSGKVRGLLCGKCNTALGSLQEDENIIKNLLNYVIKFKNKEKADGIACD